MNPEFLREAIRLSQTTLATNEGGPFGALIVRDNQIVGRGWNRVTSTCDPTAHAEIVAIRDACKQLGTFALTGCEIYCSCEPCPLCLAAIYWSRLDRIHFAATREDAAEVGFDDAHLYRELALPHERQSIPRSQNLRDEARQAMLDWLNKPDRIPY